MSTDASCADALVVAQVPNGCMRAWTTSCGRRFRAVARGAPHLGQLYFPYNPAICNALPTGYSYPELGPLLPPETFAPMALRVAPSKTRLARVEVEGGGVRAERPLWRDTELDVVCEFERAVDGVMRCLPGPTADEHDELVEPFRATAPGFVVGLYESDVCEGPAPRHVGVPGRRLRSAAAAALRGRARLPGTAGLPGRRADHAAPPPAEHCRPGRRREVLALGEEDDPTEFVAGEETVE